MPGWQPRNTARARTLRRAATPAERVLWQHLSASRQGAKFSRQMPVGPFFADFLCRSLKLVVECDGESHDARPEADARRDAWMQREGYTVLRFLNEDVLQDTEAVITTIRSEVDRLKKERQ
ncbi:endonuclease domain-containing protein [Paraurantiacibacter namhicola]|nr:endonuclease domain-containing protein [Paraurantiacibacter namhicola]